MKIEELKAKLLPKTNISIKGKNFKIIEHVVWYQVKSDSNYDKYVLEDEDGNRDYRFWISGEFIGLSEIFHHDFVEPMPKELEYEGREYKMTQDEFCIVKLVEGDQLYKVGECEIWWDYADLEDNTKGLSLGRNWETWEREDLKANMVDINTIKL